MTGLRSVLPSELRSLTINISKLFANAVTINDVLSVQLFKSRKQIASSFQVATVVFQFGDDLALTRNVALALGDMHLREQ